MKSHKNIKAISLFSGAGGLDIGATLAGVTILSAMDFDKDSIRTLNLNKKYFDGEILESNIKDIQGSHYKKLPYNSEHEKLILIGGPPCQPFSKAGYWVGNKNRKIDKDPRNMVTEYLRILEEVHPDGFLLENVASLLHPTNRHTIDIIIYKAHQLGYNTKVLKLNAIDFGVPQKRQRIFILGSNNHKFMNDIKKTHTESIKARIEGLKPYVSVSSVISEFDDNKYHEPEEETKTGTYAHQLSLVPPGRNYLHLTEKRGYKNPYFKANTRFWNFLLKLDPNLPSWTIAAQPGPWVGPFHWTSRRLRVPEIAAIQTFPKDYQFYGSRRSIQKQIGNAVPPILAKNVIEYLIQHIAE